MVVFVVVVVCYCCYVLAQVTIFSAFSLEYFEQRLKELNYHFAHRVKAFKETAHTVNTCKNLSFCL